MRVPGERREGCKMKDDNVGVLGKGKIAKSKLPKNEMRIRTQTHACLMTQNVTAAYLLFGMSNGIVS